MSGIQRRQLADGTDVVWSTPLSGMGHVADEQPLPYIHRQGEELTPRFGGEETDTECGIRSLPVPYGRLASNWPWQQRLFNLTRRRVNIYWRNIMSTRSRDDRMFFLLDQLNYRGDQNGYIGEGPLLTFSRNISINESMVTVNDLIVFRRKIHFEYFFYCPWAEFLENKARQTCTITPSVKPNYSCDIKSSTGRARWHAYRIEDASFESGQKIQYSYSYQVS